MRAGWTWGPVALAMACVVADTADPAPAVIQRSCAPWDGPAWQLTVGPAAPGGSDSLHSLRLYLYRRGEGSSLQFRLGGAESEGGAQWCREGQACGPIESGVVTLDHLDEGRPVGGRYRLMLPDGRAVQGAFAATWQPGEGFCG